MKVGYFKHQPSGCYWYRIKHPMDALNKHGIETVEIPINEDIDESVIDSLMSVQLYGSYPFNPEQILKYLKEKGIKIVYDTDDALELIEPINPNYHMVMKDLGSVRTILEYADEVTVSTPKMAEYMANRYKGKITIIPNCYVEEEWNYSRGEHHELRIGFAGSSSHVSDLIEILPVIEKLQGKYNFRFYIMGFGQTTYEEWLKTYRYIAQPEATLELRKIDELLKNIKYEWVPFVNYNVYPQTLINMKLDIGICPLKDTEFNKHRSACKAMEYTLAGALALSSDTIPYREDRNSIKIMSEYSWEDVLEHYILSPEGIQNAYNQHLKWTKENRNIDSKIDLLKSVYVV